VLYRNVMRRTELIFMLLAGTANSYWWDGDCPCNLLLYITNLEKIWYFMSILILDTAHWSLETCVRCNRSSYIFNENHFSMSLIEDSSRLGRYALATAKLLLKFRKSLVSPTIGSVSQRAVTRCNSSGYFSLSHHRC
jgi:hypothetical protein